MALGERKDFCFLFLEQFYIELYQRDFSVFVVKHTKPLFLLKLFHKKEYNGMLTLS